MSKTRLDRFDRKLLNLVQREAGLTAEVIADRVGLSPSAVLRRLRRLKAEGVIAAQVAVVDHLKVGRPTFFVTALEVERERPEMMARLTGWLAAQDWIEQVYCVTGSVDVILVVVAPDVAEYDALMSMLMVENPNVRRFTTNVALAVSKRSLYVPIAEE